MDRRLFLKLLSASGSLVLAGCAGGGGESEAPVEPEGDSEPAGTDEVAASYAATYPVALVFVVIAAKVIVMVL